MNKQELIRHIIGVEELHLHQQFAGPVTLTGTRITRWVQVCEPWGGAGKVCGTPRCVRIPLKSEGK